MFVFFHATFLFQTRCNCRYTLSHTVNDRNVFILKTKRDGVQTLAFVILSKREEIEQAFGEKDFLVGLFFRFHLVLAVNILFLILCARKMKSLFAAYFTVYK